MSCNMLTAAQMKQFCYWDEKRRNIMQPFAWRDYFVATDGRIAVLQREQPDGYTDPACTTPDVAFILDACHAVTTWRPVWERPVAPTYSRCTECVDGKKPATKTCVECGGEGCRTCNLDHQHTCDRCRGRGVIGDPSRTAITCDNCQGTARIEEILAVRALGGVVANEYLRMLTETLEGLECGAPAKNGESKHDLIPLRWAGGYAAVMPIRDGNPMPCAGVAP